MARRTTRVSQPTGSTQRAPAPGLDRRRDLISARWIVRAALSTRSLRRLAKDTWECAEILGALGLELEEGPERPREIKRLFRETLSAIEAGGPAGEHDVFHNARALGQALRLSPLEQQLLAFAALMRLDSALDSTVQPLLEDASGSFRRACAAIAEIIDAPPEAVGATLSSRGALHASGLLRFDPARGHSNPLDLGKGIARVLSGPRVGPSEVVEALARPAPAPGLTLADFDHLGDDVGLLQRLLTAAARDAQPGVNVLLYGPPGTGKTELARLLAWGSAEGVHEISTLDPDGNASRPGDRIRSFATCQALLTRRGRRILVFDEIEDVFPVVQEGRVGALAAPRSDKGWLNRLLEENPVPTIWVSNAIDQIDRAGLRRFDVILEVPVPPRSVRARIARAYVAPLGLDDQTAARIARDERATPADVARAARVIGMAGAGDAAAQAGQLERVLALNVGARQGPARAAQRAAPQPFDPALSATDVDLAALAAGLAENGRGAVCLYGPPGTGKTAFAHHLARVMDRPLLQQRASDLLGMWVGQTEQQIAGMFARARAEGAVLLLDEADSFLRDRRAAARGWEITQVNELLVQMEAHDGVFVCATNLCDALDPAAFRRFDVKVRFEPPGPVAVFKLARGALEHLGTPVRGGRVRLLRARLAAVAGVTPGDIRCATRRFCVMRRAPSVAEFVEALADEVRFRDGPTRRPAGFHAP